MRRHGDNSKDDAASVDNHRGEEDPVETPLEPVEDGGKMDEVVSATPITSIAAASSPTSLAEKRNSPRDTHGTDERIKRIQRTPVPFGSLVEALVFTLFLVLYVVVTSVLQQNPHMFYFSDRIQAALLARDFEVSVDSSSSAIGSGTVQKRFHGLLDHDEVLTFLQGPLLEAIFGTVSPSSTFIDSDADGMNVGNNRVLGGLRLRTLRVIPNSCDATKDVPEYASLVSFCYAPFSSKREQTTGYGPIVNSPDVTASLCYAFAYDFFTNAKFASTSKAYADLQACNTQCASTCGAHYSVEQWRYSTECSTQCVLHCKCLYEQPRGYESRCVNPNPNGAGAALPTSVFAFNWSSSVATTAGSISGAVGTYPGSGYVVDLPINVTQAAAKLGELKQKRYLDLATRVLVLDWTVFNAYFGWFDAVQLVFEFPSTGGIFVSSTDHVLDIFRYSWPSDGVRIGLELVLVAFVLRRFVVLLFRLARVGLRQYFVGSPWPALDAMHLVVFVAVIAMRLVLIDAVYGTLTGKRVPALTAAIADSSKIPILHSLVWRTEVDARLQSINAALMWLRWLQYTQVSPRMTLLLRTLHRASYDLVWFFVYFLTCLCALAQIAYLLFGAHMAAFQTLGRSIVTLLEAVGGRLDVVSMENAHHVLGPMFFIAFYLLLLLILLNVFLAILNDAYLQTQREQEEEQEIEDAEDEQMSTGRTDDNATRAQEEHMQQRLHRRLEYLRRYPFSNGIGTALRLIWIDLQHAVLDSWPFRARHHANIRVDPMLTGVMGTNSSRSRLASRKLMFQVQHQLEKQLKHVERQRQIEQAQVAAEEQSRLETQQQEMVSRLSNLLDSNRAKTQRLDNLENVLGSIENLCHELVTAAKEDMPAAPKKPTTTLSSRRILTPSQSQRGSPLAAALKRQKEASAEEVKAKGGTGEDIEEITL